jgi:phosphoserine aminotransferase
MSLTRKRENTINFSPGPAALPDEVVREAKENVMNYKGLGLGVMGKRASNEHPAFDKGHLYCEAHN